MLFRSPPLRIGELSRSDWRLPLTFHFSPFRFQFSPLSLAQTAISAKNIAWVFWVNRVFGVFLIYPIYPKNPKYYFFVFSSLFKQQIRITNSFSFDYANSPYHLITPSPPSYGLPADTFSAPSKSPQELLPTSLLPENQCTILNHAGWHYWHFWHFHQCQNANNAQNATCFLFHLSVFSFRSVL